MKKGMIKSIILMLVLIVSLGMGSITKADDTYIPDVESVPWAKGAIYFLYEKGVVNGVAGGENVIPSFAPNDIITREQAALMLTRELYPNETGSTDLSFLDVDKNSLYYNAISVAVEHGIFEGYSADVFKPSHPITRAETTKILKLSYGLSGTDASFADLHDAPWAIESIKALASNNLINGYEDCTFQPNKSITRAEFSLILARILDDHFRPEPANFPSCGLQGNETVEIPVLMYHNLLEDLNTSMSVDPDRFEMQMNTLKNAGYETITDYDLLDFLEKGAPLPEKPILITFDDGYISNYTEAYPILKRLGMKATMYVIVSRIFENRTIIDGEWEKITWKDAREMEGTMLIQSHSWDSHKIMKTSDNTESGMLTGPVYINGNLESQNLFEERVWKDLAQSKKVIEEKMGYEVVSIAYPYGHYSADTLRLAQSAGYKMGFTVNSGRVSKGDRPFELNRFTVSGTYSGEDLLEMIE